MAGSGKKIIFEKQYRLLRHLLFWMVYFVVFSIFSSFDTTGWRDGIQTTFLFTPINIVYVYVTAYWLVPKFLIRERYVAFFFLYCGWALAGLILNFLWRYYVVVPVRTGKPGPPMELNRVYHMVFALGSFVVMNTVAMFGIFIRMFKYWHTELRIKMKIEQEKTLAELELLKAQLHPHFLFNTLNNLYTLVLEKSNKAPDMLMRLSGLLSYVLYECKAAEVPLGQEIVVMKDYIALEQERYGSRLEISLNFSGDIRDKMIAPMLFQPFVENAFKHGTAEQLGRVWMSIELSVREGQLFFRVINPVNPVFLETSEQLVGGIGINNVRRRLDLLYPGRYELRQDVTDEVYVISLTIELAA